jgi:hypothetical protein
MTLEKDTGVDRRTTPYRWSVMAALAVAAGFLLFSHGEHAVAWIALLFALACPLMHLFHGHRHGSHRDTPPSDPSRIPPGNRSR